MRAIALHALLRLTEQHERDYAAVQYSNALPDDGYYARRLRRAERVAVLTDYCTVRITGAPFTRRPWRVQYKPDHLSSVVEATVYAATRTRAILYAKRFYGAQIIIWRVTPVVEVPA